MIEVKQMNEVDMCHHSKRLAEIDKLEYTLEQELKRIREVRREYINNNQLNKKVGMN